MKQQLYQHSKNCYKALTFTEKFKEFYLKYPNIYEIDEFTKLDIENDKCRKYLEWNIENEEAYKKRYDAMIVFQSNEGIKRSS
jgi:hypothetical protein